MPLPIIDGLTETALDAEPLFLRVMKLVADRDRTSRDDTRISLDALQRAWDKEQNPKVAALYASVIAQLRDGCDETKQDRLG